MDNPGMQFWWDKWRSDEEVSSPLDLEMAFNFAEWFAEQCNKASINREDFEKWYTEQMATDEELEDMKNTFRRDDIDHYVIADIQWMWLSWQAAHRRRYYEVR